MTPQPEPKADNEKSSDATLSVPMLDSALTSQPSGTLMPDVREGERNQDGDSFETVVTGSHDTDTKSRRQGVEGRRIVVQSEVVIERFHDAGGLGQIYRATDVELDREVAVKVLRPDRMQNPIVFDFHRETEILARLSHPGIVTILGKGETIEGRPFYAMPFMNQGSLSEHVSKYHELRHDAMDVRDREFRELLSRLISVCKTIAYAHARGVVHRDLKTENILLGNYGETFVIDWGCARLCRTSQKYKVKDEKTIELTEAREDQDSCGGLTLRYASPEQLIGVKDVGPESDVYSLGATFYKLLTGRSPYEHLPDSQVPKAVLSGSPLDPREVKKGVPLVLALICMKAMSHKSSDRYETALAMADDLERFLGDQKTTVEKHSLSQSLSRVIRRNPRSTTGVMVATAILGGLMSFLMLAENSARRSASKASGDRLQMAASLAAMAGGSSLDLLLSRLKAEAKDGGLTKALQDMPSEEFFVPERWSSVQEFVSKKHEEIEKDGIKVETLFVVTADGLQIARHPYPTSNGSIGESFAWRHYFHGLDGGDLPREKRAPVARGEVVSVAFRSTNLGNKILTALSVPIWSDGIQGSKVLGRLCMTLPINSLGILELEEMKDLHVRSMLVDMRDYSFEGQSSIGLILDHLETSKSDLENMDLGEPEVSRIDESVANTIQSTINASNRVSSADRGREHAFAFKEIRLPHRNERAQKTGWIVLLEETSER